MTEKKKVKSSGRVFQGKGGGGRGRDKLRKPPADRSVCPLWFRPRPLRPCCGCRWPGWPQPLDAGPFLGYDNKRPLCNSRISDGTCTYLARGLQASAAAQRGRTFLSDRAFCLRRRERVGAEPLTFPRLGVGDPRLRRPENF